ncbi:hypothetical protein CTAM01_17374 [Colletotrichum tamarilloi]|uniref:Fork-head domain-containing protein n=1 Tax=Colletotrichum tamarilloi TaxID=1209934 RepID=A0ABQ9QFS3_9PEZI|nr:uncharacterized protein CTAM01_17374 [Colletotrichum tamarilloi]KAK1446716.1 hypothetical protein CTAM01_17374 [Colletotrichum tamarilloi]
MTYAQLIYIALHSTEKKAMGLGELYHWFEQNTRRANKGGEGWKNSVRSNLSVNKAFQRVERKGSLWQLAEAGLTEFQPTRKPRTDRRASRRKQPEGSYKWKISVASPPPPSCAPTLQDHSKENVSGSDCGDDGFWSFDGGFTSPERSQPESGTSTDYPTPTPITSTRDGLEHMHDPLWAWNLDSGRYVHWPYCSCLCGRQQFCWTDVNDMLPLCAPTAFAPMLTSMDVGSSPPSETYVQWEA